MPVSLLRDPTGRADRRPRRPLAPFVKASIACHVAAGGLLAAAPALWPWALGAVALDHALLSTIGLWPRSTWLGRNLSRLPSAAVARGVVALTLDDGPDPLVTPAVLDLLDAHGARASFFCIGEQARRHPALCREIARRGHAVENHSDRHPHAFSLLGPRGLRREVGDAQATLADLSGRAPRFFRAPAGLRNPFLEPVLGGFDLQLASWTRRGYDTLRTDPAAVAGRLGRGLASGDILLLHDGNAARTDRGEPMVLAVLPALLQRLTAAGLTTVTLAAALDAGTLSCASPADGGTAASSREVAA